MKQGAVARRYAQALYEIAVAKNIVDALEQELKDVSAVIEGSRELQKVLYHPQIPGAEKKELLAKIFAGQISETAANFLALVVDRRREANISDIIEEYVHLANIARNIEEAYITSATEMTDNDKSALDKVLAKLTGKQIRPAYAVDSSLMGGVVVRYGDKILDGSLKSRLEALRVSLMSKSS